MRSRPRRPSRAGTAKPAQAVAPQSAAAPSPFPPIAAYAFLSNCHTGALVAPDGSIDWLCVPRFDSPSVFGALLDRQAGSLPVGPLRRQRSVAPVSMSRVRTPCSRRGTRRSGWIVVRDALTMGPRAHEDEITPHTRPPADDDGDHMLVRTILCLEGNVEVELVCEPVFDYGRTPAQWSLADGDRHTADATGPIRRSGSEPTWRSASRGNGSGLGIPSSRASSSTARSRGPRASPPRRASMRPTRGWPPPSRFWRAWLHRSRPVDHPWRTHDRALGAGDQGPDLHAHRRHGRRAHHLVARDAGGERNWDYRFTWIRDSTFTLQALHFLNLDWEADEFMQFVADLEPNEDGALQIMYGIDGRRDLTESTRDELSGYAGARPVRLGNGAFDQRQNDVFGAALDSILLHTRRSQRLPRRLWPIVQAQAECATQVWRNPDQGIWEARGEPQHYVSSKLMCWVALDRAAKLAEIARRPRRSQRPGARTADEIKADILEHGVRDGVLRQHYDTDALDASTLLAALFGFLPGDDERLRRSVQAIADDLTEDGFVLRYRTDETDDGLSGKEGSFLICSFWLVSALAIVGDLQARPRPDGAPAQRRLAARSLRRGVRHQHRPAPGQLPAGLLPPRADRGRRSDHPRRTAHGVHLMSSSWGGPPSAG